MSMASCSSGGNLRIAGAMLMDCASVFGVDANVELGLSVFAIECSLDDRSDALRSSAEDVGGEMTDECREGEMETPPTRPTRAAKTTGVAS